MRSAFFDPLTRQPENIELEQTTLLQFRLFSDCQVLAVPAEKDCCKSPPFQLEIQHVFLQHFILEKSNLLSIVA